MNETQGNFTDNIDQQTYLALVASLSCMSITIVATNAFVCAIVYLNKTVRTCTNCFVVSLAVSDIIMGAFFFPLHIAVPSFKGIGILTAVSLLVGVANVVCLTYDRYLSISSPLTYTMDIQHRFKKMIVLCWVVPILYAFIPLAWNTRTDNLAHVIYTFTMSICGVIIPYIFIFSVYFYIFKQVKKCSKRLQTELTDQRTVTNKKTHLFIELKVARVFIVIASIFLCCWAPVLYITTVENFRKPHLAPQAVHITAFYMLALESLVNPFIYCFLKPDIQSALRRTLKKTWRRDMTIRFTSKAIDNGIVIGTSNTNLRVSNNGSSGQLNAL
ncbi:histamine H2 receptor [Exaiptasia diaphana]|uniref:G-protein coupled receptors family 1 profile domain-containing protein n=1 Tax=Exaiptasia diaphana TaxID=2652724 RepID=A0A913XRN6_EXADI|nr:histamine H2 receptor [Exaiptasia diaphana]XP_020909174.1 histamine H2 receptor [Exaiptasia diaphana]XP_020909175.1 histamine H2 receptor [Exaiptasia diaphana]XP_020909176.1 histamine H2 receptor [Exaiptasia diaphana]XP_020909177.1 histamine H2 receptor [Exaiptasia diaphana]XP_020909178.1 histamine H2 receptor [Exaiptasia diaphana]